MITRVRKADWTLMLTIVTLVGVIWAASAKTSPWDQAVKDISELRPKVENNQLQIAILTEKLTSIDKHLESIDKKTK